MASFDNLIMDSALRVSAFDLETKQLLLMMTQPTDATLNATSESTDSMRYTGRRYRRIIELE